MPEYQLSTFYQKKLLIPGWAGELDSTELAYIKSKLKADRRLRARWGFKRGRSRLSEEKIRRVALEGVDGVSECPSEDFEADFQLRLDFEQASTSGKHQI